MPNFSDISWPLIIISGLFNTIGWIAFVVGKRREEILRMEDFETAYLGV